MNTDLRIGLHVGQLLQRVPGGIGRYVSHLHRALLGQGASVVPFAAGPPPAGVDHGYVDLGFPRGTLRLEAWHRLRAPVVQVGADVVHAPSLAIPPTADTPLVVTVHDLAFDRLPQYFTVRGIRFHTRGLALARRHATTVVVPSHFVAGELVSKGFDESAIHVAPHGIDTPPERPAGEVEAVLDRLGVPRPYVLFVGTLEPRKGVAVLVEAFRQIRERRSDLHLAVAGPRGWGRLPDLDRPGVARLGAVSDDDLDALYRGALLLAYPSRYEGFGLPVLEAMVRGCPVVATDATSLPEVIGDAGRLVRVDDPDALAVTLGELADDRAERERLADAGRARAGHFKWGASAEAHLAAYRSAIADRGEA